MSDSPVITEQMRQMVGVETPPYSIGVERADLLRYIEATGEENPSFV